MRYIVTAVLLLCLSGCAGTRQTTVLDERFGFSMERELSSILRRSFAPEAYDLIKDIPLIDGPAFSGYSAGTSFLSNVVSLLTFNGWGRKVIIPSELIRDVWGIETIIHEYVHQLDDIDRDDDLGLIDKEEFRKAFISLEHDFRYAWIAINANRKAGNPSWFYDTFVGVGPLSERIAYVAGQMATTGRGPDYMWHVLRHVLKNGFFDRP